MRLILFILSPFLTFLYSCFDLQRRSSQVVFVLFFALFGYCHTFEDVRADSHRKYLAFRSYSQSRNVGDAVDAFRDGDTKDIFEGVLFSVVRKFTDNPHVMMMLVGAIGGYFYMLVMRRFCRDRRMHYTLPIVILLLFMLLESNIPLMGGIRNFVAFPLFLYSMIRVVVDGDKWWLIGLIITPLIHFSYVVLVALTLVVWLLHIPNGVLHYVAVIACVASIFLDTSSYSGAMNLVVGMVDNEAIAYRVENYGAEDTDAHFNKSLTTRLVRLNNQLGAVFVALLLIYVRRNRSTLHHSDYEWRIYHALLFFVAVSFMMISFSVVGQRFVYVAMVLLYLYLLNLYQLNPQSTLRRFILALPLVYILHIAWSLYNCYCNVDMGILYMPLPFLLL